MGKEKTKRRHLSRYLKDTAYLTAYAWKTSKSLFFVTAVKSVFAATLPLIHIAGLGIVVEALSRGVSWNELLRRIIGYLSINLAIAVLTCILTWLENNVMRRVSDRTQLDYMRDCVYINYHYAQDGSILDLKKKSTGANPAWFLIHVGYLLRSLVQLIGVAYVFLTFSPLFTGALLVTSAISVCLTFRTEHLDFTCKNELTEEERKLDYLYKTMTDYAYAKELRINQATALIENQYSDILAILLRKRKKFVRGNMLLHSISVGITVLQTAIIYLYLSHSVLTEQISIAEYTVLLGATTLLTACLLDFFKDIARIKKTLNYTELFRTYREMVRKNSDISASDGLTMPDINRSNLTIAFEHVSFTYPGTERPILQDIHFTARQGEKLGIVGLNGSGKTTLIKLLCRLYDPTVGRITLNGVDIKTIPHGEYTKMIGIVLQDFCLFAYSVRENIEFDTAPSNEGRLRESIRKSGLCKKIGTLPFGLDTDVYKTRNDHGVEFSGGEGQKLALARAIYKDADILILDEPTSAMDPIAEYELFSGLAEIAEGKMTWFISHRLSSTKFCDRILVLSEGKLIETGDHETLLRQGGLYAELFHAQAKYYEMMGGQAEK